MRSPQALTISETCCRDESHHGESFFHRYGIRLEEQGDEEVIHLVVQLAGFPVPTGCPGIHHGRHIGRCDIGGDGDHPFGSDRHHGKRQRVITREDDNAFPAGLDDFGDLLQRPTPLLDGRDVADGGQPCDRGRQHVHAGSARNVVQHQRQVDGFRHGLVMAKQPLLGRLVIVRRDQQRPVCPGSFGVPCQCNRFLR